MKNIENVLLFFPTSLSREGTVAVDFRFKTFKIYANQDALHYYYDSMLQVHSISVIETKCST